MTGLEPAATPLPVIAATTVTPPADPYEVYLNSLQSTESRRTMRGALDRIAKILTGDDTATGAGQPWWGLRFEHAEQVKAALVDYRDEKNPDGYSPTHINKHLIGLRRILRVCWRMELMTAEEYHRAADIQNVKGERLPAGRSINGEEIGKLLKPPPVDDDSPADVRDLALVALLYSTAIRRAEAARLKIEDYDRAERQIRVIGKRNKERLVPVNKDAVPVLDAWLNLLGARRGPMFRRVDRHGNIHNQALSPRSVGYIVDRSRGKAKLAPMSTHDFRRTFIGDLLDAGVDIATVQQLVGHASPVTTARYDRRPARTRRAAVDKLPFPTATQDETRTGGDELLPPRGQE